MKAKRYICLILALLSLLCCIQAAAFASEKQEPPKSTLALSELDGKRIGVLTGSIHDAYIKKFFPNAQISYFSVFGDEITALKSGSIDSFSSDNLSAYALIAENPEFSYIDDPLDQIPTAFAFAKDSHGEKLCGEMNAFLKKLEEDGSLAKLQDKWLSFHAGDYALDLSVLENNAETLRFATSCAGKPNSYYYNGAPTGYEIELALLFCQEYGYNLEITVTDFAGIIPGLCSGKYDFGADGIAVTEERSRSVHFSSPDYNCSLVMVVREEGNSAAPRRLTSIEQFNNEGVSVGLVTGMSTDLVYAEVMPKATVKYYNGLADIMNALSLGQIDGLLADEPMCRYLASHTEGVDYIDEVVGPIIDVAFVFGKTDFDKKLKTEFDEFIVRCKADGTIAEILDLWYGADEEKQHVTIPTEGKNGTIKLATDPENAPIVMIKDEELCGAEIDILARFCTEYGYALDAIVMNFDAIINSVNSGRANIGCSFISVTDERKETVIFSEPYHSAGMLMEIRAPEEETELDFWAELAASFERTFIKEARWKLIVEGIKTTIIISLCASVLGTVFGFGLCLLRRMKNPVIHSFTTVYIRILQGTPLLVLLMILYYIIFAKSGLSGEVVAIFAFALNFAAYVCEMFRTGIDSVDNGQVEAAYAIGFTKTQTFCRIIMPQAAVHFLPVYKGEFISLLKTTSVVGYIAVQDLTKMSDIIRSRTYEAFFPLIATAIIYFILSALLTSLLRLIEVKVEPDRKNRTVKGVIMQ